MSHYSLAELDRLERAGKLKAATYRALANHIPNYDLTTLTAGWNADELAYAREVMQSIVMELHERASILEGTPG